MTEADRDRIAALGHLCELALRSAWDAQYAQVVRFHFESAQYYSDLAFKVARS